MLLTGIVVQWRRRRAERGVRGGGVLLRRASSAMGIRQRPLLGSGELMRHRSSEAGLELSDSLLVSGAEDEEGEFAGHGML